MDHGRTAGRRVEGGSGQMSWSHVRLQPRLVADGGAAVLTGALGRQQLAGKLKHGPDMRGTVKTARK